ncbi:MAG: hypothetical protein ABI675_11730 [Chitinophagaceae bacterium]
MKTLFLAAILLSMTNILPAQTNSSSVAKKKFKRYWLLGAGNSTQSMYDEAISFVRYRGSGIAPSIGLVKGSDKIQRQFIIQPTFVKLTTTRSNGLRPMEVLTTRFFADYQYLVEAKEWNDKMKLYTGGNISLLFNLKRAEQLDNSQLLYDYALSIGPSARLDKIVNWKKRACILSWNITVPLLSHIARPYYLNRIEFIDPKNDFTGDLLKNSSLGSIDKHFSITSGVSLTYPLFNGNALKLGYSWDYYRMKTINKVYSAGHLISISFLSNY